MLAGCEGNSTGIRGSILILPPATVLVQPLVCPEIPEIPEILTTRRGMLLRGIDVMPACCPPLTGPTVCATGQSFGASLYGLCTMHDAMPEVDFVYKSHPLRNKTLPCLLTSALPTCFSSLPSSFHSLVHRLLGPSITCIPFTLIRSYFHHAVQATFSRGFGCHCHRAKYELDGCHCEQPEPHQLDRFYQVTPRERAECDQYHRSRSIGSGLCRFEPHFGAGIGCEQPNCHPGSSQLSHPQWHLPIDPAHKQPNLHPFQPH